jgi:hypothetical protein
VRWGPRIADGQAVKCASSEQTALRTTAARKFSRDCATAEILGGLDVETAKKGDEREAIISAAVAFAAKPRLFFGVEAESVIAILLQLRRWRA